ncbi:hypothetical protein FQA39_LY16574 [Lamprigera yunnana]|nr:hypothetical protein FQA39_LY16574 [Lamprigera yunnana]
MKSILSSNKKIITRGLGAQGKPLGLVYQKAKLLRISEPNPALYELSPYSDDQGEVAEMRTMSSMQPIEDMKYSSRLSSLNDEDDLEKHQK